MKTFSLMVTLAAALGLYLYAQDKGGEAMAVAGEKPKAMTKEEAAKLTDEEWKKRLTPEQYAILRKASTERSWGKVYKQFKAQGGGTYFCAGCNAELFSSKEKFDSQCGWPSFYDPSKAKNVKTREDRSAFMVRTEVLCAVCDGHLGHVFTGERFPAFNGEETPTGQRYCINGTALKFVPFGEEESKIKKPESEASKKEGAEKQQDRTESPE